MTPHTSLLSRPVVEPDASSGLRLPSFFSDHMVLQQEKAPRIWGRPPVGATVAVKIAAQEKTVTADAHGKWFVELEPLRTDTGPLEMTIRCGSETRIIRNILAGGVWLCAGQSNMAWPLRDSTGGADATRDSADAKLRFFVTAFHAPDQPAEDCEGTWVECNPRTSAGLSGVAYYSGRQLRQTLNTPVGLILSAQGDTTAESWLSREALRSHPALQPITQNLATRVIDPKDWDMHLPGGLFHGRIAPLARLSIRGVIWYQGETNAKRARQYRTRFPLLIADWRKTWDEELPFYFVQLANFGQPPVQPVNGEQSLKKGVFSPVVASGAQFAVPTSGAVTVEGRSDAVVPLPLADANLLAVYHLKATLRDDAGRIVSQERAVSGFVGVRKATAPVKVDGVLDEAEWARAHVAKLDRADQFFGFKFGGKPAPEWAGVDDLSAQIRYLWDDQFLYVAVDIKDDIAGPITNEDELLWKMDGVQFLVDPARHSDQKPGKYEYSVGLGKKGPQSWCALSASASVPSGNAPDIQLAIKRSTAGVGDGIYEVAIPWSRLAPLKPSPGNNLGFTLIVNEDDGPGRDAFMTWFGNAHTKDVDTVGDLILLP